MIVEILAVLQRIGHQPPPAPLVQPEDALQAVRTAIMLSAMLPDMRVQADALAGDLAELLRLRKTIVAENEHLSRDLDLLGHEQLRLNMLIDERQQKRPPSRPLTRSVNAPPIWRTKSTALRNSSPSSNWASIGRPHRPC